MRKHRGLRRYYRKLQNENDLEKAKWADFSDPDMWFDNWHLHFDWWGYSNNSFKRRKPHLDKLFRHFNNLEKETRKLKKNFQLHAVILDKSSEYDAVFVNTPNPNREDYLWQYESLDTKSNLTNSQLEKYLDSLDGYEKFYGTAEDNCGTLSKCD
jgi:hypothetical protein